MPVILGTGGYRYEVVDQWAKLPPGREFNADVAAVGVDGQDRVYAFNRGQHPMVVFDRDGNFLRSWGEGVFRRAHGVDAVADLFIRDITQGIGTSGVKAAIIKCATDTAGVTPVIENVLRASARAQKATGVPISTHTWAAGRTGEMQQAIFAQEGIDLSRVIIGHSGDSEDLGYLRGLMERGSTIGMDRFGLEHFLPTAKRVEVLARLCAEGYAGKMVLSHDVNCWSDMLSEEAKRRVRPLWHYNHISDDILPALRKAGVKDDQIERMLVTNPRAIFEGRL